MNFVWFGYFFVGVVLALGLEALWGYWTSWASVATLMVLLVTNNSLVVLSISSIWWRTIHLHAHWGKNGWFWRANYEHRNWRLRYVVYGRGCNPHRSLWRHCWRHNSETIRDRKNGDHLAPWNPLSYPMVKTAPLYDNFCKTGNYVTYDVIIWVQHGNCKKWLERILVLVRSTI